MGRTKLPCGTASHMQLGRKVNSAEADGGTSGSAFSGHISPYPRAAVSGGDGGVVGGPLVSCAEALSCTAWYLGEVLGAHLTEQLLSPPYLLTTTPGCPRVAPWTALHMEGNLGKGTEHLSPACAGRCWRGKDKKLLPLLLILQLIQHGTGTKGFLFTADCPECAEDLTAKPQESHKELQYRKPCDLRNFEVTALDTAFKVSSAITFIQCCSVPCRYQQCPHEDGMSLQLRHLINTVWTTSSQTKCTYAPVTTEFSKSNLIFLKAPGNPLIKTHYLQLPGAGSHGIRSLEFIQLCAVSSALVCLAITAMAMGRRWQRSSKMRWRSARQCCRKAQTKKNPTAASKHNLSLCRYKLIKRVFDGCRNQSSFQPSASRWGGWSTLPSVQGRTSSGVCGETAVTSWASA